MARVGILAVAFAALSLRARTVPARSTDPTWQLALERGVGCVRAVAERGMGSLDGASCAALGPRPLAPLLGAWGKLSVGRVGLLDPASSERWPWLVLGALAPLLVFELLRRAHGDRTALFGAAWLLALPGFTFQIARADSDVLLGVSWLPALAAYAAWLAARRAGSRARGLGLVALGSAAATALVLGAAWVLALLASHFALARPSSTSRLLRQGRAPLPSAALPSAFGCALAAVELDPSLWHSDPARIMATLFGSSGQEAIRPAPQLAFWIWGLAALGLGVLVWRALGRRFATGELRPARDVNGSSLLVALGLALGFALGGTLGALPFVAMAAALGASALSALLVRERWRVPLQFVWLVLAAVS